MTNSAIKNATEYFWRNGGQPESFPRSLESSVSWALPVAIIKLPRLWIEDVRDELNRCGIAWTPPAIRLCLRGFMIAARGRGFIFINATDSAEEQRYSLAHEVAHFLLDYYFPRLEAITKLGPGIAAVLDGDRPASLHERVDAALSACVIGSCQHVSQRDAIVLNEREDSADALAVELLAPTAEVWSRVESWTRTMPVEAGREKLVELLQHHFGFPTFAATGMADRLAGQWWPPPRFRHWMGIKR